MCCCLVVLYIYIYIYMRVILYRKNPADYNAVVCVEDSLYVLFLCTTTFEVTFSYALHEVYFLDCRKKLACFSHCYTANSAHKAIDIFLGLNCCNEHCCGRNGDFLLSCLIINFMLK